MFQFSEFVVAEQYAGHGYAVIRKDGMFALVATRDIAAGEFLFRVSGKRFTKPSFTSVQTGPDVHIDVDPSFDLALQMDRYPWRFTNHHCDANVRMTHAECVALRAIKAGEEITFNYNTTERVMDEPFGCRCGVSVCTGMVGGYALATREEKERLAPFIAPYLAE